MSADPLKKRLYDIAAAIIAAFFCIVHPFVSLGILLCLIGWAITRPFKSVVRK